MPRPLRSAFPYGVYHLTSRGVDGRLIFTDDEYLEQACRYVVENPVRARLISRARRLALERSRAAVTPGSRSAASGRARGRHR